MVEGLYVHIPFCERICAYCDFAKIFYDKDLSTKYLNELKKEIDSYKIDKVKSIYIGGGTPSVLTNEQLEYLLSYLSNYLCEDNCFTIEANVENLTVEKIKILKKYHINRISLGIQTFNETLQKRINRHSTYGYVKELIETIHNYGIHDINVDLIYGLPGEDIKDLEKDLEKFLSLDITHISCYALSVNPHTLFFIQNIKEQPDEIIRNQYDLVVSKLQEKGFYRYEVSNFSKRGFESKHNLLYWKNKEYYGVGLGASGYLANIRYNNTRSINDYLNGKYLLNKEEVSLKEKEFYYLMLNLRLINGFDLEDFKKEFNKEFYESYKDKIERLIKEDLICIKNNRCYVNDKDLFILDYVLRKLLF